MGLLIMTPIFPLSLHSTFLAEQIPAFDASMRSLLRKADLDDTGIVAVNTAAGAHLTADFFLVAL